MFKIQPNQLSFDQDWLCPGLQDYCPYQVYLDHDDERRRSSLDSGRGTGSDRSLNLRPRSEPVYPIESPKMRIDEISNPSADGQSTSEELEEGEEGEEIHKEEHHKKKHNNIDLVKDALILKWKGVLEFDPSEEFAMKVVDVKRMTNQLMKEIFQDMKNELINNGILSLNNLNLNFSNCFNLNDQGIKHLVAFLTEFKNLESLTLNFEKCQNISNESVAAIAVALGASHKNLQNLNLSFYDCYKINDKGIGQLAAEISKNLHNLRSLKLDFRLCWKITDYGIFELTSIFPSLENLQSLSILTKLCCEITDQGVKAIVVGVQTNLKKLQFISLNIVLCDKITTSLKESLAESLSFVNSQNVEY